MGFPRRIPADPKVYDIGRVCNELGLTRDDVQRQVNAGRFPKPANFGRDRGMWRWSARSIDAWLTGESFATVDSEVAA